MVHTDDDVVISGGDVGNGDVGLTVCDRSVRDKGVRCLKKPTSLLSTRPHK